MTWIIAPNPGPLTLDGTRSYAVGDTSVAVIDPGPAADDQLDRLRLLVGRRNVVAVCLTHAHRDHSSMAAVAASEFDAPVAGSAETLRRCGLAGTVLGDGAIIPLDGGTRSLKALSAPGHSADHLVFLLEPSRALFTGDLVLGTGSSVVLHPDGDVGACLASFDRLLDLQPGLLFPGHGDPVEDGAGRLLEYREHRRSRHEQVVRAVRAGGRSVRDLRLAVYGDLAPGLTAAADASVRAHVAYMRASGEAGPHIEGMDEDGNEGMES